MLTASDSKYCVVAERSSGVSSVHLAVTCGAINTFGRFYFRSLSMAVLFGLQARSNGLRPRSSGLKSCLSGFQTRSLAYSRVWMTLRRVQVAFRRG